MTSAGARGGGVVSAHWSHVQWNLPYSTRTQRHFWQREDMLLNGTTLSSWRAPPPSPMDCLEVRSGRVPHSGFQGGIRFSQPQLSLPSLGWERWPELLRWAGHWSWKAGGWSPHGAAGMDEKVRVAGRCKERLEKGGGSCYAATCKIVRYTAQALKELPPAQEAGLLLPAISGSAKQISTLLYGSKSLHTRACVPDPAPIWVHPLSEWGIPFCWGASLLCRWPLPELHSGQQPPPGPISLWSKSCLSYLKVSTFKPKCCPFFPFVPWQTMYW